MTGNGDKITVVFGGGDGKPICPNRKHWARHLGTIVRDNFAIKHRTLKWKFLVQSELDNLWQHVLDTFIADDIANYRDSILRHMQHLWNRWRRDLNRYYIDEHDGDMAKITNNKPPRFSQEDWEWILKNHYFTDQFKKASSTNKDNRKKHKYAHHTGSKPFSQVACEMMQEEREKEKSSYEDVFADTYRKNDGSMDSDAQSKYDHMREIREMNPSISDLGMAEEVFGIQCHGSVIGMGTGILASQFRAGTSRSALRQENSSLRDEVLQMKSSQSDFERSINERLEQSESLRIAEKRAAEEKRIEAEERIVAVEREFQRQRVDDRIEMEKKIQQLMVQFLGPHPSLVQPSTSLAPSTSLEHDDQE